MLKTITSVANTVGALEYKGLWNAATNTPTLVSSVGTQGDYYVVSVAGTTNLNGVTTWDEGDWAIFNGSVWQLFQGGQDGVFATLTVSDYAAFADNAKATFGTGAGDLQIYHNGANNASYIEESGTGDLYIRGNNLRLQDSAAAAIITGISGGATQMAYAGGVKLSTTATGIDIVGIATMDGLTVDGDATVQSSSGTASTFLLGQSGVRNWRFQNVATTGKFQIKPSPTTTAMEVTATGDVSFYEDTGTTPKMVWSASAESLGIGTSTPNAKIEIDNGAEGLYFTAGGDNASNGRSLRFTSSTSSGGSNGALHTIKANSTAGEIAFANGNGNIMYLNSAGLVGIGTNAPVSLIEAAYSAGNAVSDSRAITISTNGGYGTYAALKYMNLDFAGLNDNIKGRVQVIDRSGSTSSSEMSFSVSNSSNVLTQAMLINAVGSVGIGTSFPVALIHGSAGDSGVTPNANYGKFFLEDNATVGLTIATPNNNSGAIVFADPENSLAGRIRYDHNQTAMIFDTEGAERARLDSNGNLLVGKTSNSVDIVGGIIRANGLVNGCSDSNYSAIFSRNTNDGDIVLLRKDGVSVGSIGVEGGNLTIDGSTAAGKTGIEFSGAEWFPRESGANSDGLTSLGNASNRFKDLYLSGGVVFGTTGGAVSSKTLDDFETGSWTPTFTITGGSFTSITYNAYTGGVYTKIGNVVYFSGYITTDTAVVAVDGDLRISGLPFTVASGTGLSTRGSVSVATALNWVASGYPFSGRFQAGTSLVYLNKRSASNGTTAASQASDMAGTAQDNELSFSGFYFV